MTIPQPALVQKDSLITAAKFKIKTSVFFIKLLNWEYWSFGIIYTPIYFYWFYLCFKARNLFFFAASNPSIENGGFLMERKSDIYKLIPPAYYPETILIKEGLSVNDVAGIISKSNLQFPVIVKPDIGFKGIGVRKLFTLNETAEYITLCGVPMLVQEFIDYENEAGIFYYRFPWEKNGYISGIVLKEYVTLTGDGTSNIEQLILQNQRYILQLKALMKVGEINFTHVLKNGEKKIIVPFGNHARGAKFIDASERISATLQKAIDDICKQVPGFYYGRLDIKFVNWHELSEGKNISIIEINGAGSEPTHMYDPAHSLFFAWKEIMRHWKILWQISCYNNKHKAGAYLTFKKGIDMFKENKAVEKKWRLISGK
jgi:hypothetical protein